MCFCKCEKRHRLNGFERARWLRRLRLRYIWKVRQTVALDRTGRVLDFVAKQLAIKEVYSQPDMRNIRYAIIRQLWRFDKQSGLTWHEWTEKNGWSAHKWQRRI